MTTSIQRLDNKCFLEISSFTQQAPSELLNLKNFKSSLILAFEEISAISQKKFSNYHCGPEKLKKSLPKKIMKSNKSILPKIFLTKFHFLQFQKWPKINF